MSPTSIERFSAVSWPSVARVAWTDVVMACPLVCSSPLPATREFDFQTNVSAGNVSDVSWKSKLAMRRPRRVIGGRYIPQGGFERQTHQADLLGCRRPW